MPGDPRERSEAALACLSTVYRFQIGEQFHQPEMLFHRHPSHGERGLLTWIPLGEEEGIQVLFVESRTTTEEGVDIWNRIGEVPFFRVRQ